MKVKICKICGAEHSDKTPFRMSSKKYSKKFDKVIEYFSSYCVECERKLTKKRMDKYKEKNPDYWRKNYSPERNKIMKNRRFFRHRASKFRREYNMDIDHLEFSKFLFFQWKRQKGLCGITGRKLTIENAGIDHIIPRTKGGNESLDNLRWVTKQANKFKSNFSEKEFSDLIFDSIKHDEKLKGKLIYIIACALQKYDEEIYDECEGHYTSFADKFII